jgi:hypothetical protein
MDDLAILPVPARPSDEAVVLLASELHGISIASLPVPARPSDEAVVLQLASELHGISIASYHECLKIAKALLDVGCPSLMSLVALPELKKDPINSLEDVQSQLQNLRYPLGKLQFIRILRWIQQQRQMPASNVDVGSQSHQ